MRAYKQEVGRIAAGGECKVAEIIRFVNSKSVLHELVYKICVVVAQSAPKDLEDVNHNLVVSSCKGVSYLFVSVSEPSSDPLFDEGVDNLRKTLDNFEKEIKFSQKMECHQMRKNVQHLVIPSDVCE